MTNSNHSPAHHVIEYSEFVRKVYENIYGQDTIIGQKHFTPQYGLEAIVELHE